MAKYRKRPVVVEAVQLTWENWGQVCELLGNETFRRGAVGTFLDENGYPTKDVTDRIGLFLPTEEGVMLARQGDWIIKGVKGEVYLCKPEIFEETYEPVEE